MKTIYYLDKDKRLPILMFPVEVSNNSLPFFSVEVEPPVNQPGMVLWWATDLDPVADPSYGKVGTGVWEYRIDNRAKALFRVDDGSRYEIGSPSLAGGFDGIGDVPSWLTELERPTQYHTWSGSDWEITAENETKRLDDLSAAIRSQRDGLIAQTDWTQLDDSPYKGDAAWLDYRQQLRYITEQSGFPDNVVWPTAPIN